LLRRLLLLEHPDLDADEAAGACEVGAVVARDSAPDGVAGVEKVSTQVVERGVFLREHGLELSDERRREEQPRHQVAVRPHEQPRHSAEEPLVRPAVEELVVEAVLASEVEVHIWRRLRWRQPRHVPVGGHAGGASLQHVPQALLGPPVVIIELPERGAATGARQQPRRAWEGLAEEIGYIILASVDEEDALCKHRIEEGRRNGEHPVAEASESEADVHEVPAVIVVLDVGSVGFKPPECLLVRDRAGAASLLERFLLPQLGEEVG
jgi:hypothetical protein